jgi:putative acetyltransferase
MILTLRHGQPDDLSELQQLFVNTVAEVCKKNYDQAQIQWWVSTVGNTQRWQEILEGQYVLVAQNEDLIVGFSSLNSLGYVDMLYVHKDYQRQGIGTKLYMELENEAIRRGNVYLNATVSITAKPFFEKQGYTVLTEQDIFQNGVTLSTYLMTKKWGLTGYEIFLKNMG